METRVFLKQGKNKGLRNTIIPFTMFFLLFISSSTISKTSGLTIEPIGHLYQVEAGEKMIYEVLSYTCNEHVSSNTNRFPGKRELKIGSKIDITVISANKKGWWPGLSCKIDNKPISISLDMWSSGFFLDIIYPTHGNETYWKNAPENGISFVFGYRYNNKTFVDNKVTLEYFESSGSNYERRIFDYRTGWVDYYEKRISNEEKTIFELTLSSIGYIKNQGRIIFLIFPIVAEIITLFLVIKMKKRGLNVYKSLFR